MNTRDTVTRKGLSNLAVLTRSTTRRTFRPARVLPSIPNESQWNAQWPLATHHFTIFDTIRQPSNQRLWGSNSIRRFLESHLGLMPFPLPPHLRLIHSRSSFEPQPSSHGSLQSNHLYSADYLPINRWTLPRGQDVNMYPGKKKTRYSKCV